MELVEIGSGLKLNVMGLVDTRLLIQANSGGGKSMTLRTILEKTYGKVPHIILDTEGEFSSLRAKFDYILAGGDGDIPAEPRTAALLARRILELNASIIIDLYELAPTQKSKFVRIFLNALINAPKDLWGARLLVIDEAHEFCPEKGQGESEAWEEVIMACSKGRKRGLGTILATQRPSKLNKSAAAECRNKLIGLANLDIDRKRGAQELGFSTKEDILQLRDMQAGEFFAVGPALSRFVVKSQIHEAKTPHPKIGHRLIKTPAAPAKVKRLLEKLKDLPQEAAQELKTQADMMAEIARLKRELVAKPKVSIGMPLDLAPKKLEEVRYDAFNDGCITAQKKCIEYVEKLRKEIRTNVLKGLDTPVAGLPPILKVVTEKKAVRVPLPPVRHEPQLVMSRPSHAEVDGVKFGGPEKAILNFLLLNPERPFTSVQVAIGATYSPTSSSYTNALSKLRTHKLIVGSGKAIRLENVDAAFNVTGYDEYKKKEGKDLLDVWMQNLGHCEREILKVLLADKSRPWEPNDLAEATPKPGGGFYSGTSSSFTNALSKLNSIECIKRERGGPIRINPEITEL